MQKKDSIVFVKQDGRNKNAYFNECVLQMLLTMILTAAFCGQVFGTVEYNYICVYDAVIAAVMVIVWIFLQNLLSEKERRIGGFLSIVALIVISCFFYREFTVQTKLFFNSISEMLGGVYGKNFPLYALKNIDYEAIGIFAILFLTVTGIVFYSIIRYGNITANILLIVCSVLFQGMYGTEHKIYFAVLFILGNIIVIRKYSLKEMTGNCEKNRFYMLLTMIFVAMMIASVGTVFQGKGIEGIEVMHYRVKQFVEKMRYEQKGDTALIVTMSIPQSYYLRGFVGEHIGALGWEKVDSQVQYEYADLFYWLHKDSFFGQTQLAKAAGIFKENREEEVQNEIHIKNIGASTKYIYVPYEYVSDDEGFLREEIIGDETIEAGGVGGWDEYTFTAVSNQVSRYPEILKNIDHITEEAAEKYISAEGFYNEYVYQVYTKLREEELEILENHLEKDTLQEENHLPYYEAKAKILNYLSEKIVYENTDKEITGDFLKNFLEIECAGNDSSYASASTLMFRYYGIPARYVEGYIITPENVEGADSNQEIKIPEANRHSWVEYYQDGVGWIPFETAPPYIDLMEKADDIYGNSAENTWEEPQNVDEITQDNYVEEGTKKSPKKHVAIPKALIPVVLAIMLGFLVIASIVRYFRVRRRFTRNVNAEDLNMAIRFMFSHMMNILFQFLLEEKNQLLKNYESEIRVLEGDDWKLRYIEMVTIYEKARYSGERCTEEERKKVYEYMSRMKESVYASLSRLQKIKWKFVMFYR